MQFQLQLQLQLQGSDRNRIVFFECSIEHREGVHASNPRGWMNPFFVVLGTRASVLSSIIERTEKLKSSYEYRGCQICLAATDQNGDKIYPKGNNNTKMPLNYTRRL
jgi:hypothetical protein